MTRARKRKPVIIHRPRLRLPQLARRTGGISAEAAIGEAEQFVEELRGPGLAAIDAAIATLETLCAEARDRPIDFRGIRREADRIITFAGTFAIPCLVEIAKRLIDLSDVLAARALPDLPPIIVHVRAMRLLSQPESRGEPALVSAVLDELRKVAEHFNVPCSNETEDWLIEYFDPSQ